MKQRFLEAFSGIASETPCCGRTDKIMNSDVILIIGTRIVEDSPRLFDEIKQVQVEGTKIIYMHPIEDPRLDPCMYVKYEVGSEEGVVALLAEALCPKESLRDGLQEHIGNLDLGYMSAESNVGEEEIDLIRDIFSEAKQPIVITGPDFYHHPRMKWIARYLGVIQHYSKRAMVCLTDDWFCAAENLPVEREEFEWEDVDDLQEYNGNILYHSPGLEEYATLIGSKQFSIAAKIQDGAILKISVDDSSISRFYREDESIKGTIAILSQDFEENEPYLFSGYRFVKAKILKSEQSIATGTE